jgi:hypothetical protein
MLDRQAAHKLNTGIYPVSRELEEVESAAKILGGFFEAPVANFDQATANLITANH